MSPPRSPQPVLESTAHIQDALLKHSDDHSHGSNCQTKENGVYGFIAQLLGITFDFAILIDDWAGLEEKPVFNVSSYEGMSVGLLIALIGAIGSTYCHLALNENHQKQEQKNDLERGTGSAVREAKKQEPTPEEVKLSCPQKFALHVGDRLTHMNEITLPLMGAVEVCSRFFGLSRWTQAGLDLIPLVAGYRGSHADVQTCGENLLKRNQRQAAAAAKRRNYEDEEREPEESKVDSKASLNATGTTTPGRSPGPLV